jgi:hypothetical protein
MTWVMSHPPPGPDDIVFLARVLKRALEAMGREDDCQREQRDLASRIRIVPELTWGPDGKPDYLKEIR